MSGAVEGVEASAIVEKVRQLLMEQDPRLTTDDFRPSHITFAESCVAYVLTTPPARSYADGVRDSAKVADEAAAAYASIPVASLLNGARRGEAERIAAAIRLLSQGGKA